MMGERQSDLSAKSSNTDGSSVLKKNILRSYKQKEYTNLKPVLLEAAERHKSPSGSLGRGGRSSGDSSGQKVRVVNIKSVTSTPYMRSLDANNSKQNLQFQTIGSQNQSSHSNNQRRSAQQNKRIDTFEQ